MMNTMNFRKKSRARRNSTNFMADGGRWRTPNRRLSRLQTDDEDSDEDDEPHRKEVTNWAEELFGRRSVSSENYQQEDVEVHLTKKQTLILSTLLPDEILLLDKYDAGEPRRFVGVLMMADVSGYTALSERYNNTGKGGTYRLTVTLNTYLGALIEIIYSHGGDIIKFAGDAFLALWKTDRRTFLSHTIHSVIACALVIQHSYARYETDVKVNLRVKLAISAGNLMFSPIGAGIDMSYVIFGLPVMEAKLAESLCASGEVKITPTAWAHCYSRNYDHILHEDGHVTVLSILYDPHENDVTKPFLGFGALLRQVKKTNNGVENLPDFILDASKALNAADLLRKNEVLSLRKAILTAEERNVGSKIRNFMIRPVLTQIDAHQPLEYLTEMRQVSVLFITLKPRECPPLQFITIVNNSYQITCEIVYKSMGCVNKIILFDKDVMILVIFGLRGFKHESEAQAALKCAYSIRKFLSALDGVQEVSIGVTTGQVYCGVVGHPLRREFTVIGGIVNKAARLMCSFRNRISCDEATFVKSKMSTNGFTLQPQIELKGIGSPGKMYEYTEEIRMKEFNNIPMIPPLLNRIDEIDYFENWLDQCHLSYRDFDALLLIGESRIGKSRMLEWLARMCKLKGLHVCNINLTSIHSANQYLALSQIINQILGLETEPTSGFIKEQKIVELLKEYDEDLCYLNNIIKVRFAYHEGAYSVDEERRIEKAKVMFNKLIGSVSETHVILLDDLHNLDASSWDFLSLMLPVQKIFTVLSVTRGKFSTAHKWLYSVFIKNTIRKVVLGPLASEWIPPLACQILDVDAVPNDLCIALRSHCKGMPGLIESFIVHLFSSGGIEIKKIKDEELEDYKAEDLQFPDPELLKPQALNALDQKALDQCRETDSTGDISICVVTDKDELINTNVNAHNVDTVIMVQIDALTPYQQLLLKIASVIGNVVSRDLLENIMYENNALITAKAVKRLFAMKIFCCASAKSKYDRKKALSTISLAFGTSAFQPRLDKLDCQCNIDYNPDESNGLPKYAFCKVMRFRNKNSRKTCYELLPMNQKKEFHSRIVHYLESNKQKCPECGGTLTIIPPLLRDEDEEENVFSATNSQAKEDDDLTSKSSSEDIIQSTFNNTKKSKSESFRKSDPSNNLLRTVSEKLTRNSGSSETTRSFISAVKKKSMDEELPPSSRRSTKRVTISSLLFKDPPKEESFDETTIFGLFRAVVEAQKLCEWHQLGVTDSLDNIQEDQQDGNKSTFAIVIERGVSQTNFKKCTCADLNILIYEQLIHHAIQAELKVKAIEFLIHHSYLCLLADNNEPIIEKLDEAERYCIQKSVGENAITQYDFRIYTGRIYSLKAAYNLLTGKLLAAKWDMERALRIYRIRIFKGQDLLDIKNVFNVFRKKHQMQEKILKADSVFCLNVATLLYAALGDDKLSRKCASNAVALAQKADCRVTDLCDAFTAAMQIELDRGLPENTTELERIVKHVLRQLPHPVKSEDLYALGKLFLAAFRARLARGELAAAIRAGFRATVVSNFLRAFNVSVSIIPDLFFLLVCRRRIDEAIDLVQLSLRMSRNRDSQDCETWYYALCMDLILDAGFQLEAPADINRFCEFALHTKAGGGAARRRLVVNLWTYWLRVDAERKAKKFEAEAFSWLSREDDDATVTSLLSALRLAEGMIESLARKMDDLRKVVDLMELRSIADRELTSLEKNCKLMRITYARWMRLKASSYKLSGRHTASATLFNQSLEESRRLHNHLEEALARASSTNSRVWINNARTNKFPDWQTAFETLRESWHQNLYTITTTRR